MKLFLLYSQAIEIMWAASGVLPHFLRFYVFRLIFKSFGKRSFIDYRSYVRYPWRVTIGARVAINRGCEIYPSMRSSEGVIVIGNNVSFGPGVKLFAATHDYSRLDLPDISGSITIKDHVWVGGGSVILPGVTVGEGAVIGAGSVVTKDVEPFTINAGVPARQLRKRELA